MPIEVEVLCDSVCETSPHRLTTLRVKAPAMIHQEMLRHRALSFSVSSMRAIPLKTQIQRVLDDPAMPVEWGSNRPGMQAGQQLTGHFLLMAKEGWGDARDHCVAIVETMEDKGLHKQVASRLLQPWSYYEMVITGCWPGWANFFALRCHPAADPTMRRVAVRMADVFRRSTPQSLRPGDWHLP